jgi:hypothetical protein
MSNSEYRGSTKHKHRPVRGRKGTFCPEWTHATADAEFKADPFKHPWDKTEAHAMFQESLRDPNGSGKRYATRNGIAFVAQQSGDGTWHGYPEPWNKIPTELKDKWIDEEKVTSADLRRYKDFPKDNLKWAFDSDTD